MFHDVRLPARSNITRSSPCFWTGTKSYHNTKHLCFVCRVATLFEIFGNKATQLSLFVYHPNENWNLLLQISSNSYVLWKADVFEIAVTNCSFAAP
jgi:hypothetical protein